MSNELKIILLEIKLKLLRKRVKSFTSSEKNKIFKLIKIVDQMIAG